MSRRISHQTNLENLRKEAKRWLKSLRANDKEARARLTRVLPGASDKPVLRDVQHALALEYGFENWNALKKAAEKPGELSLPPQLYQAVREDRSDVVETLLDSGVPADLEDPANGNQRPLHVAAAAGAETVALLLIKRGAKIDPVDVHGATPLWLAVRAQQNRLTTFLSRYSRDVWALTRLGDLERLREVLRAEPRSAVAEHETTPLFWLPDDEQQALAVIELLLSYGVNARVRRKDGKTAAEVARENGLSVAAERLEAAEREAPKNQPSNQSPEIAKLEGVAKDLVTAYATGDAVAMQRINQHYGRNITVEDLRAIVWRLTYKVRQAGGSPEAFGIAEAQELMSRTAGFPNWTAMTEAVAKGAPSTRPVYFVDAEGTRIEPRRIPTMKEWDEIIAVMKERRIPQLNSALMTDEALKRISELEFVTALSLGGSREMSDEGMQYLARMPQLEHLNLSEYPGGKLSDRGLEVLRHLPNLRTFEMTWQRGITDKGAANLQFCSNLERVDLMGSPTGDGVIEALRGKPRLRSFSTGRLVTDSGLALLREFPVFVNVQPIDRATMPTDSEEPTRLLIDGPFTNAGLATLAGMQGIYALDLFWHVKNVTGDGFAHLLELPNLLSLGCDGALSNDDAMRHIGLLPRLRRVRVQESVATEEGFVALSKSQTLEGVWGRECPNFASKAFVAFSRMPALRNLGIGCHKVDNAALSTLPDFPSLRELTPIGFVDDGFRHIGRCKKLDRLLCMYCRETGDVATGHIANLHLKSYYAGLTQITDRSLEILSRMASLEIIELFETKGVTDAGLAHLTRLPRLKKVELSGLPHVTPAGTQVFLPGVQVHYEV